MFRNKLQKTIFVILTTVIVVSTSLTIDQFEPFKDIQPDTWGVFYAILGVTFAMIAGLVLVQSLDRYTDLKYLFNEELNALQDMRDYLIFLDDVPPETIAKIRLSILRYVEAIIEKDWIDMQNKRLEYSDTNPEMYDIMRGMDEINIEGNHNRGQSIALEGFMNLLFTITTFRTKRFFTAKEGVHKSVFNLILLMASAIMIGLVFMDMGDTRLHVFIVASTHLSLVILIMILYDLSNPFSGMWKIDLKGFELFRETLKPENQYKK